MVAEAADARTELLTALERAESRPAAQIAVLWTWLEKHLNVLGSFDETDTLISERAQAGEEAGGVPTAAELKLIKREPGHGAAAALARIASRQRDGKRPANVTLEQGVDGEDVLVSWRTPFLHGEMVGGKDDDMPPASQQAPSLAAIAPGLHVCPVRVGVVSLEQKVPTGDGWDAAQDLLSEARRTERLTVHLDPLVNATAGADEDPDCKLSPPLLTGTTGWDFDYDRGHALLLDAAIEQDDHDRCIQAARAAVRQASGQPSVLVLPELVATEEVLAQIGEELREQDEPPALTVVGLRHREGEASGLDAVVVGDTQLARHVNEAVVLGPDGSELWRHRKLTRARAGFVQERIAVGDKILVVDTPIGIVAVSICLDVFTDHVRERLTDTAIELLLVPSLSPHVHRHRTALAQIAQGTWGVTFVCNRGFRPNEKRPTGWKEPENQSFWVRPSRGVVCPDPPKAQEHRSFVVRLPPPHEQDPGESEQDHPSAAQ